MTVNLPTSPDSTDRLQMASSGLALAFFLGVIQSSTEWQMTPSDAFPSPDWSEPVTWLTAVAGAMPAVSLVAARTSDELDWAPALSVVAVAVWMFALTRGDGSQAAWSLLYHMVTVTLCVCVVAVLLSRKV